MDDVARWPAAERASLFQETAARAGMPGAVAVEKDFWVCWALRRAFGPPGGALVPGMVFKGGTSLSKVYGAITRFSEDLDLSIPREALGFVGSTDLTPGLSRTQAGRRLDDMRAACEAYVGGALIAELRGRMADALGSGLDPDYDGAERTHVPKVETWDLAVAANDPATLLFRYPAVLQAGAYGTASYIRPTIRLEFGGRNEVWPAEAHRVRPYTFDAFPALSADPWIEVHVLAAERTFWEKATILHAEYYRPTTSRRGERLSRHYADLAVLAGSDIAPRALRRLDLLQAVATHKARYFPATWARYDAAHPGALRLVPHPELERVLRRDYAAMREMFFAPAPTFDGVIERLGALEAALNTPRPQVP